MISQEENQFDSLDLRIIDILSRDARIAFTQLAEMINASNSFVHQRYRKLKDAGVLKNAVYDLDPKMLGYETCAYTQIMLDHARHMDDAIGQIKEIPEVVECVNITGRYDIMVKIYAINNKHLRDIIYEKIQPMAPSAERTAIFEEMRDMVMADTPYIGSMARTRFYVINPWLRNYKPEEVFYNWVKYMDLDESKRP